MQGSSQDQQCGRKRTIDGYLKLRCRHAIGDIGQTIEQLFDFRKFQVSEQTSKSPTFDQQ